MQKATEAYRKMITPVVHYVGFRDDRFTTARRIWGGPAFIHRQWDLRRQRKRV